MPATPPTDSDFFEFTRAQIEHEDSLINNRLTWLLSLQAFLFAAYGFSLSAESNFFKPSDYSTLDANISQRLKDSIDQAHTLITQAAYWIRNHDIFVFCSSLIRYLRGGGIHA